ncbi:MAG: hypothetical protein B0W54_22060 [Cellvibrio sp. 79]|nr:MAG: hypothetical protein B0W54_22060 [Cellvibrio sp. 79]
MPLPETKTLHCFKSPLDVIIEQTAAKDGPLTQSDINKVMVAAQIQDGIERYRSGASDMEYIQLRDEEHDSARLGRYLIERHGPRPPRCHAHAIVAGRHKFAAAVRLVMAKLKIRIDDTDNGCWLPENTAATPHPAFPKAPPHSRIHRSNYFFWIRSRLVRIRSEKIFRLELNLIASELHNGNFPKFVMLKKGVGLPIGAVK